MLLRYARADLKEALANTAEDKKAQVSELLADFDKKYTELNDKKAQVSEILADFDKKCTELEDLMLVILKKL